MIFFEYPKLLFLELILIPLIALYIYREINGKSPFLMVSNVAPWRGKRSLKATVLRHIPFILRMVAIAAIIVAVARPRTSADFEKIDTEGIDIVLAMDVSTSMLARDFYPDRIGAAKEQDRKSGRWM